jgi:hypothetical protein
MAREKPLDVAVVQAWQAAWNESDIFSDAAVLHLQSFIQDPLCSSSSHWGWAASRAAWCFDALSVCCQSPWKSLQWESRVTPRGSFILYSEIKIDDRAAPTLPRSRAACCLSGKCPGGRR